MKISLAVFAIALLCAGALGIGCKKPEPPPPAAPVEKPPEPGIEYTAPSKQAEYETAWRRYINQFEAPAVGDYLWVKLNDGTYVGGEVKSWSSSEFVLRDGTNDYPVTRAQIAKDSRARAFADAFARAEALAEIEEAMTFRIDKPTGAAPMVGSLRYTLSDDITAHSGPASRFRKADAPVPTRGTVVQVLEQRGVWIRVEPQGSSDTYWINGLATRPTPTSPAEDYTELIKRMLNDGLLTDYNEQQSSALVHRGIWVGSSPGVREGLCRLLAEHSAHARKSTTEWIEVKDSDSGRRLARYSQAQGYRGQ